MATTSTDIFALPGELSRAILASVELSRAIISCNHLAPILE